MVNNNVYRLIVSFVNLLIANIVFSCSCCYNTTTFCGTVSTTEFNSVALLEIQAINLTEYNDKVLIATVVDDLKNNIEVDTIKIFSSLGTSCSANFLFEVKDTVLIKLDEIFFNEEIVYISEYCSQFPYIKLEHDTLFGRFTPDISKIAFSDFKNNFQECQLSSKYINVGGRLSRWQEPEKAFDLSEVILNDFFVSSIDTNGYFSFSFFALNQAQETNSLRAYSEEGILENVSISDIVKIQRHILLIEKFTTPWQLIAADVNNSGSITAFDILEIRKVLLGLETKFSNNYSWLFIEKDYIFSNPNFPWTEDFFNTIHTDRVCSGAFFQIELLAIKIGDVEI